jgi:hypothetical protein
LGATVKATVEALVASGEQTEPQVLLYAEKKHGFSCATCVYATPVNATHGKCRILTTTIHLDDGCCIGWQANPDMLHLYREPVE